MLFKFHQFCKLVLNLFFVEHLGSLHDAQARYNKLSRHHHFLSINQVEGHVFCELIHGCPIHP